MLISHPDRSLADHLAACDAISQKILVQHYVSDAFFDRDSLEKWRKLLVYFHDLGKATDFFQARIFHILHDEKEENEKVARFFAANKSKLQNFIGQKYLPTYKEVRNNAALSHHAAIGGYFVQAQLPEDTPMIIRLILQEIIKRHHGHLQNHESSEFFVEDDNKEQLDKQIERLNFDAYPKAFPVAAQDWDKLEAFYKPRKIAKDIREYQKLEKQTQLKHFFLQHYLFSLLLSADKGDMQLEADQVSDKPAHIRPVHVFAKDLITHYKKQYFSGSQQGINQKREVAFQQIAKNAEKYADHSFFSITLPTGMGKTLAAYHAAIQLQHAAPGPSRIIYCLPFTSVIDQNAQVWEQILKAHPDYANRADDFFAVHHYLSPLTKEETSDQITIKQAEYLVEGWEQDFIITTYIKLMDGIFTNRNRNLRKFHNMTNAIILLDEVQNIPPKYYEAIEFVFRGMAQYFGTKFVFITATQPLVFKPENRADIIELAGNQAYTFFDDLQRIELDQTLLRANGYKPMKEEELLAHFVKAIAEAPQHSFLLIFNTIKQAQAVFFYLKQHFEDQRPCLFLSASLLPFVRQEKIEAIKANQHQGLPQIIVSTQVVEAGMDIDLDIVYRDFAPLDSINQSAGRCNRHAGKSEAGKVRLFRSGKDKWIYDGVALAATEQILADTQKYPDIIPESRLLNLNQDYFALVHERISKDANDSARLMKDICHLQLADVAKNFKLIESQDFLYHNVFIPCNTEAEQMWQLYRNCIQEPDGFARKRKIKQLRPRLLRYVTRFPQKSYTPPAGKEDQQLIYCQDWDQYYDLETGFKNDLLQPSTLIL
ncbi:MAG: CRISPR-associated helicase Cas3' [Bernardetiaceae bacterium]